MVHNPPNVDRQDTFMDSLRASTTEAHQATEGIPFNGAILAKSLPRDCFAAQVRYWAEFHTAVESALQRQEADGICQVWALTGPRAHLLRADLACLGEVEDHSEAQAVVEEFSQWIDTLADTDPIALLGVLYVFEGSQLGGTILKKPLAEMYELTDDHGLSYYSVHGSSIRGHWTAFRDGMNQCVVTEADQSSVIRSANQTFTYVGRLLECLSRDLSPSAI